MSEVDVIIEISKGGHIKYEYDKEKNIIVCDRILHTPMKYPFNYGFIPDTLSEDGDPLDVVVLMEDELIPGCIIKCCILGYLETKDDAGNDPKLIVRPVTKIDPTLENINDIQNLLPNHILNKIQYFFNHYKDLENKTVTVGKFYNKWEAIEIYSNSKNRFKYKSSQKNKITDYFKSLKIIPQN
jgi:inorganic pyrophosphatase